MFKESWVVNVAISGTGVNLNLIPSNEHASLIFADFQYLAESEIIVSGIWYG